MSGATFVYARRTMGALGRDVGPDQNASFAWGDLHFRASKLPRFFELQLKLLGHDSERRPFRRLLKVRFVALYAEFLFE
jgi:hypothetical protein